MLPATPIVTNLGQSALTSCWQCDAAVRFLT